MSVLVVGVSHRTAPVELLEQLALDPDGASKLAERALDSEHVNEAIVLATCNRIEVYADVDKFHGGMDDVSALLTGGAGVDTESAMASLYVHYDEGAVAHLFSVASGLKSMVVGESQILGQVRDAFRRAQSDETVGAALNSLFQQGLRVGKRAHAETSIDRAGQSMVSVALDEARHVLGSLAHARVGIVGAGSMAALAAQSVKASGAASIVVASRTTESAERLAAHVHGSVVPMTELGGVIADVDLLISCTGAQGRVVTVGAVETARAASTTPLVVVDLALPHDVEREVDDLPGVTVIDIQRLSQVVSDDNAERSDSVAAAERIVTSEVAAFVAAREAARATPTVVALRTMSSSVVAAELERLFAKLPDLDDASRDEIAQTLRRTADKLLHEPTVRVKELAGRTPDASYADALAELFALDSRAVEAVSSVSEAAGAERSTGREGRS